MTFNEMKFQIFRNNSYGYRTAFENGLPLGYGEEVEMAAFEDRIDAENRVNEYWDDLHDTTTPLYRADDGQLYKVVISGSGSIKVWARALLLSDRGKRLAEFRETKGTLKDIENTSGIPLQSISKWENNARDVANASGKLLLKLSEALGVSIEELVR